MEFVKNGKKVVTVAGDTDVLVLINHHWDRNMENIYFMTKKTKVKEIKKQFDGLQGKHLNN